jgi:hypothetical protein
MTANVSQAITIFTYESGIKAGNTNQTIGCVIVLAPNATATLFDLEKFTSLRA